MKADVLKPSPHGEQAQPAQNSPVQVLRTLFIERKNKNAHYSLNAFARDLGIQASLLSRIFSGSRSLTLKQGMQIAAVLGFSEKETQRFVLGIVESASKNAKISNLVREKIKSSLTQDSFAAYTNVDVERFKSIAQWYHLAILNLTAIDGFNSRPTWIAKQLGITSIEVSDALERLLDLGLLEEKNGKLKRTQMHFSFNATRSETALRLHHSQMIEKAKAELQKTSQDDFSKRLINSITFVCGPEHIPLLQKKINEFQDEVLKSVEPGSKKSVYQMNSQLFPLTQNGEKA